MITDMISWMIQSQHAKKTALEKNKARKGGRKDIRRNEGMTE